MEKLQEDRADEPKNVIARLLIKEGLLTEAQLRYASRVQSKLTAHRSLAQVFQDLGYITAQQLRMVLRNNRFSLKLGELLLELGAINREQLESALSIQQVAVEKKRLGEILIESRIISERELIEILSVQLGIPYIDPQAITLNKELLDKVPLNWYSTHRFIPVSKTGDKVLVALVDPMDQKALDAARMIFGRDLLLAICSRNALSEAMALFEQNKGERRPKEIDESKVVGAVNSIMADAARMQASDIHIEPQRDKVRIRFRIDGALILYKELELDMAPALTNRFKILAKADIAERRRHQDGRILFENPENNSSIDMRVSFFVTVWGEKIVLRLLSSKGMLLRIQDIGIFPNLVERFCYDALDAPTGVILITGPTGSGKTTTLYSCVRYLDKLETSIVTVEDPVEYIIDGIAQCSINPKINLTFEESLKAIVRQDPDVIVVGEIRDSFSAETCIQASLTGHKVLATFHTEDSVGALIRLLNMNIEPFLISSTVVSVVAQRLLRRVCPQCEEAYIPTPIELHRLGYTGGDIRGLSFKEGRGCPACHHTGYRGRVGVHEILILNEMVKDAIISRKTSYEIRRISIETAGLVTLFEDGFAKAARGETSLQEVLRLLPRVSKPRLPHELKRLLGI